MAEKRLTATAVSALKTSGWHADGAGLYCRVRVTKTKAGQPSISKSWVFVVQAGGERREYQLGPVGGPQGVSLAIAREKAQAIRDDRARGNKEPAAPVVLYKDVIDVFIEARTADMAPKAFGDFTLTLKTRAPSLMTLPLDKITMDAVEEAVRPVMDATPAVGKRMLTRLNLFLTHAAALKHIPANPLDMTVLNIRLGSKAAKTTHREAVPYSDMPATAKSLHAQTGVAAQAVEMLALLACRLEEVREMAWSEIDEEAGVFVIPAARAKTGRECVKPLPARALAILKARKAVATGDLVFASESKEGTAVAPGSMRKAFRAALPETYKTATLHGLRSTFSDYCHDKTEHAPEVIEGALGHLVGNVVARTYRRGQAVDKMRACFGDWSAYLAG